jgi:uncharacterized caspase-like protein
MPSVSIRIFLVLFIIALIYPSSLIAFKQKAPPPKIKSESPTPPEIPKTNTSQGEAAEVLPGAIAATERRIALVIGNSTYTSGPLKNPVNDAADMAAALKRTGFTVTLKKNANLQEMVEVIEEFGNNLKKGGVGLFYYAGHGVQVSGVNYLLPISARIKKESDVRFQAVDAGRILAEMENANNGLNIVLLDACRDNPFGRTFRNASRGLAIVTNAPTGTFISYSTGAGQVARDGEGRNSPYTSAVLKYMQEPAMPITDVFIKVRQKLRKETGQVPWELSSLEGRFYFIPGENGKTAEAVKEAPDTPAMELDPQRREIEAERERLQKQRDLLEQKEALAKEKEELAERERKLAIAAQPSVSVHQIKELDDKFRELEKVEQAFKMGENKFDPLTRELMREELESKRNALEGQRKQLAMGMRPSVSTANEIKRDGRFIAYHDGTVLDTQSNLMWAAKDNGYDIKDHSNAKRYCENYRGGGYSDWRMPTRVELAGLYDKNKPRTRPGGRYKTVHVATDLIDITSIWSWASETRNHECNGGFFNFFYGSASWSCPGDTIIPRALPVRSGK